MRISYEAGLESLAMALEEYGHELFPAALLQESDAILYQHSLPPVPPAGNGAMLVQVGDQSPQQIREILATRLYSQLF